MVYKVYAEEAKTWDQASISCFHESATLAVINSEEENDYVEEHEKDEEEDQDEVEDVEFIISR